MFGDGDRKGRKVNGASETGSPQITGYRARSLGPDHVSVAVPIYRSHSRVSSLSIGIVTIFFSTSRSSDGDLLIHPFLATSPDSNCMTTLVDSLSSWKTREPQFFYGNFLPPPDIASDEAF